MSDGSQVLLRYCKESTYKVLPGSPAFKALRHKGDTLGIQSQFVESEEITADPITADTTMVDQRAPGTIDGEFSYATWDDFFEWVLGSNATWSSPVVASGNTITVASVGTIADSGTAFAGISAGEIVRTRAMHNSLNNGWHVLSGATSSLLTVLPADLTVDATGAVAAEVKSGALVRSGTTFASAFFERVYGDLSSELVQFPGGGIQSVRLSFAKGRINNVGVDVVTSDELSASSTSSASIVAANSNPVMNSVRNVKVLRENHVALKVRTLDLTFRRNLRERDSLTTRGIDDMGLGSLSAEINFEAYYSTKALADKHRNETESNIFFVVEDNAGNGYAFWFSRVKLEQLVRSGGGKQTDVLMRGRFRILKGTVDSVQIARFAN